MFFADQMAKIFLNDNTILSPMALKEMRKADLSKTKIKSKLDQQSAAYILQGYLDRYRNN